MPSDGSLTYSMVADGVYAAVQESGGWFVSNAGWVQGKGGVLAVDAFVSEVRTERLLAVIETKMYPPDPVANPGGAHDLDYVLVLVVTHEHGDHANGAYMFEDAGFEVMASHAAGDEIIAHGIQTYPGVLDPAPSWGAVRPPRSIRRLADDQCFDLGGVSAEVLVCPHHGHTSGDLVVREPDSRTVFSGDLVFNGVTPLAVSGSVVGWLSALDWLADLSPAVVVPGHGPVTDARVLDEMRRYLEWIINLAPKVADGADPIEIARRARAAAPFPDWDLRERDAANLMRAASDLGTGQLHMPAALRAIIEAHGGPIEPPH